VQQRTTSQDTFGQQTIAWTDVIASVPASITPLSGRELIAAQAINAEITHEIVVRYHPLLADPLKVAAMRLVYVNGTVTRYFNIQSAMNVDERNRQLTLMAVEGLNQQ
jgi:SPP1 family predicted phage head-tail adaptor